MNRLKSKILFFILFLPFLGARAQTIPELTDRLKQSKSAKEAAVLESDIGRQYFSNGDFLNAQKFFFASLETAEKLKDDHLVAVACNNVAATYMESENYPQAEQYAKRSISLNNKLQDHKGLADAYNSLANIYYMLEQDSLSMKYYLSAIKEREIVKDSAGLFAAYKNLGANLFEIGEKEEAIAMIEKSIRYLSDKEDTARWYSTYLTLAQAYLYSEKLNEAKRYLDLCEVYLKGAKDISKIEDYYYTLSRYFEKRDQIGLAYENYKLYAKYRDSVINSDKNKQLSALNIKYDTEKKQNTINSQLFEIRQKNYWLIALSMLFLLSSLAVYFGYKNYRNRQEKKLQQEIFKQEELEAKALFSGEQQERIRVARELHDSVGQMLSLLKMKLSAGKQDEEGEQMQQLVDRTIGEVRSISHNLIPEELHFGLFAALESLAEKVNAASRLKMEIDIPDELRALSFQPQQELSIYRIVQELLNNVVKHAGASLITLSFRKGEGMLIINTADNGKGFDVGIIGGAPGIGWKNINARVRMMDGTIKITSGPLSTGTQIEIILPQNG